VSLRPQLVILGGPNGAGKTAAAPRLLRGSLHVSHFVNADVIARGLSGFDPDAAALDAGQVMLCRMRELAAARTDFAFESTLASRSLAPWIADCATAGYQVHILFLWLPSAEMAIARVESRVRRGGHGVPEATIRRRYQRGIKNFFGIYRAAATTWHVYDHQGLTPRLVAAGRRAEVVRVADAACWEVICRYADGPK